jgi:hypothetical protein
MIVIDDTLKSATIDHHVAKHIDGERTVDLDNSTSYINLKTLAGKHTPKVIPKDEVGKMLP